MTRTKTLSQIILRRLEADAHQPIYEYFDDEWRVVRGIQFLEECRCLSLGFFALGARPSEKIALALSTSYEWVLSDLALQGLGAVSIPLHPETSLDDWAPMIHLLKIRFVICESRELCKKLGDKFPDLTFVVRSPALLSFEKELDFEVLSFQEVEILGKHLRQTHSDRFLETLEMAQPEDTVSIQLSSGTYGSIHATHLTQGSLAQMLTSLRQRLLEESPSLKTVLSYLPFDHFLGRTESLLPHLLNWKQIFAENMDRVLLNIQQKTPDLIFAIPSLLEQALPILQNTEKVEGSKKIVRTSLKAILSGGAQLLPSIREYFEIAGIRILDAYGNVETGGIIALDGKILPEAEIRFTEENEIEFRRTVDADWISTGDLGYWDAEGHLKVRERKASRIGLSNGKIISAGRIQDVFGNLPNDHFMEHLVPYGQEQPYLVALISLKQSQLINFARRSNILFSSYVDLVRHPLVRKKVAEWIAHMNQQLSTDEQIFDFFIVPKSLSRQSGDLSVAQKARVPQLQLKYSKEIAGLYSLDGQANLR